MNKKRVTIMTMAAILVSTTSVACGTIRETGANVENVSVCEVKNTVNYEELFAYTSYTPEDQIVKGRDTALNTISDYLGKKVNVTQDYYMNSCVNGYPAKGDSYEDVYRVFDVRNYDDAQYQIFYLFQDDTKLVEATDATQSYVAEDYQIDKSYMNATNENNFSEGAFASKYDHVSTLILSKESGYNVSSIWGYNSNSEEVTLIWKDSSNPIWKDYN